MMKRAFTLVELLIVIIIIGILATMSIPQYQKMVNRAKWAECVGLAGAIKTAQSLYFAENGGYTPTGANLSDLNTLDLPASRKFNFNIKVANMIYGWSNTTATPIADNGDAPTNRFYINLTSNATGYEGTAPGSL